MAAPEEHGSCSTPTPDKGRSPSVGFSLGHCLALLAPCPGTEQVWAHPGTFPERQWPFQGGCTRAALGSCCRVDVGGSAAKAVRGALGCAQAMPAPPAARGSLHRPGAPNPPGRARCREKAARSRRQRLWHGWEGGSPPAPHLNWGLLTRVRRAAVKAAASPCSRAEQGPAMGCLGEGGGGRRCRQAGGRREAGRRQAEGRQAGGRQAGGWPAWGGRGEEAAALCDMAHC